MRYYCNICKKDITKAEFLYSIDKFDKPLCREHQKNQRLEYKPLPKQEFVEESEVLSAIEKNEEEEVRESKSKIMSKVKRGLVTVGKGIVKGTKKLVDASKKTMQIRRWKEDILRRMSMSHLKRLCFEKKIGTKKNVLKEDGRTGDLYWKEYDCTKGDLVSRIKNRVQLDYIINYAKRNHVNIRDILRDINQKKTEWQIKDLNEKMREDGEDFFKNLEKAILEFITPRRYYNEEKYYQDTLASWLKSKFPDTDIEVSRGSTRPDIVVGGVAIEVKGPTFDKDLTTIPDKCVRYYQYFPSGMICVLFNVHVNQQRYNDWLKGMNEKHPEVLVIKK
jgi:hypothetical protein